VSEFHVERERNAYGKPSNCSDTLNSSFSSPRTPSRLHAPSRPLGPGSEPTGPETRGPVARVSTEKQEREETVASQVDLLYQAAAASGYDIAPTSVFIDEGVSGARLDRPALDRLRDLAQKASLRCCW
jgi:Resolvase, N terminal domain